MQHQALAFLCCLHLLNTLSHAAGVTEMAAFGCAIVFDLAVGKVLPTAGWNGVIKMLLVCAVAGTAVMAVFMQQEKRVVDQQNQMKAAVA